MATRKDGGVSFWSDIVQYLLWSYSQTNHITDAILQLRATKHHIEEVEQYFARYLNDSVGRCGHVHDSDVVITLFF